MTSLRLIICILPFAALLGQLSAAPANDAFASAQVVSGNTFTVPGDTTSATVEPGEPTLLGKVNAKATGHTVWYKWVAPKTGQFQVSAFSNQFDTALGVFTGTAVSGLASVAANDDGGSYNSDALATFTASAGVTYSIAVDSANGSTGAFTLSLVDSLWQYPTQANGVNSAPSIATDGSVYFGSEDGGIYALVASGARKWLYATWGPIEGGVSLGSNNTVYAGSLDGRLYALDATAGSLKWSYHTRGSITSTPTVTSTRVYVQSGDGYLYAFDTNGLLQWSFFVGGNTYSSPAVASDGTIYAGSGDRNTLYAITSSGGQKWSLAVSGSVFSSPAIGTGGIIYFGALSGDFYAVNPDGSIRWRYSVGSAVSSSPALGTDGSVYFGAYDHNIYALTSGGIKKWTYATGSDIRASSPAVASNGMVFIGSYDNYLYALFPDGTLFRGYATAGIIRSSPAILNGRVYVGSNDAKLYAFDLGSQTAAPSAWAQFHGNAQKTGVAP